MSEEKKCINNEELCEGKQKLSIEELENVNGGGTPLPQGIEPGGNQYITIKKLKGDPN